MCCAVEGKNMVDVLISAKFILQSIRKKYPQSALVPEISIEDYHLLDTGDPARSSYMPNSAPPEEYKSLRRIDALMFETLIRTAIEIKVTKADFNRDTYWKRRAWQNVTHRFIYVVPHYLDVMSPHGCGLWKVHPSGKIEIVKKAIMNKTPEPLPQTVIQRLAYRAANNS